MAINFVLAAYVYFLIPETKQVPLEEIDVLFGGANHVDKGANILGVAESKTQTGPVVSEAERAHEVSTV